MDPNSTESAHVGIRRHSSFLLVGAGSLFFAILQSACTAVMAISGLRLIIGITSLTAASIPAFLVRIHVDRIRIPMLIVAVVGALIDLYVLWRIRSLRSRPAAQWRIQPISSRQRRAEAVQFALAVLTLILVMVESVFHYRMHGA